MMFKVKKKKNLKQEDGKIFKHLSLNLKVFYQKTYMLTFSQEGGHLNSLCYFNTQIISQHRNTLSVCADIKVFL